MIDDSDEYKVNVNMDMTPTEEDIVLRKIKMLQ